METCPACPACRLLMRRRPRNGAMAFECPRCHHVEPGTPAQHRVFQRTLAAAPDPARTARLAFDPTAMRVARECPRCGRAFMTLCRTGESERISYMCPCEYRA